MSSQAESANPKKRKVTLACIYCRQSHLTCDRDRPCQRCIKRNMAHLCRDPSRSTGKKKDTDHSTFRVTTSGQELGFPRQTTATVASELREELNEIPRVKKKTNELRPHDFPSAFNKFGDYIKSSMSTESRDRILDMIQCDKPKFIAIQKFLTDADLAQAEREFQDILLEYERVFSAMKIPACLWRRSGEICKINSEFASLVGIPLEQLREEKSYIYKIMTEQSFVSFYEKYTPMAIDEKHKAFYSSCHLRNLADNSLIPCSFSVTIRRDRFNLPSAVIGNFLPTKPPA